MTLLSNSRRIPQKSAIQNRITVAFPNIKPLRITLGSSVPLKNRCWLYRSPNLRRCDWARAGRKIPMNERVRSSRTWHADYQMALWLSQVVIQLRFIRWIPELSKRLFWFAVFTSSVMFLHFLATVESVKVTPRTKGWVRAQSIAVRVRGNNRNRWSKFVESCIQTQSA